MLRFIDLFAGIGGFRMGMEQAGHRCAGYVEIDKYARRSYEAVYDTEGEWSAADIRCVSAGELRAIGRIDCFCGGFPCQTFSIAGRRSGFEDTRGTLFFEIARLAQSIRPPLLFLENVKGLLSHGGGAFKTIHTTLDDLGYDAEWQVLNSKDFGVPQNRERVYIVGYLRGKCSGQVFPLGEIPCKTEAVPMKNIGTRLIQVGIIDRTYESSGRVFSSNGLSPTLVIPGGGGRTVKILNGGRVRCLTPREYWRLQGFPDWAFERAEKVNSDTQLYKQAGNSVTVPVIAAIADKLSSIIISN